MYVCDISTEPEVGFEAWERMGTLGHFLEDISYSVNPNSLGKAHIYLGGLTGLLACSEATEESVSLWEGPAQPQRTTKVPYIQVVYEIHTWLYSSNQKQFWKEVLFLQGQQLRVLWAVLPRELTDSFGFSAAATLGPQSTKLQFLEPKSRDCGSFASMRKEPSPGVYLSWTKVPTMIYFPGVRAEGSKGIILGCAGKEGVSSWCRAGEIKTDSSPFQRSEEFLKQTLLHCGDSILLGKQRCSHVPKFSSESDSFTERIHPSLCKYRQSRVPLPNLKRCFLTPPSLPVPLL